MNPPAPTSVSPPSHLLVGAILTMITQNGMCAMLRRPKPHTIRELNRLRFKLLQDRFFDPDDHAEELQPSGRRGSILYMDLVVLLARLMRVLVRREPLSAEQRAERVAVRNEVLGQPFFDRELEGGRNPFVDEEFEDEGVDF